MRLSLKNVFKNPQVCGKCPYDQNREYSGDRSQEQVPLDSGNPSGLRQPDNETFVFWTELPDHKEECEDDCHSGEADGNEFSAEQDRLKRIERELRAKHKAAEQELEENVLKRLEEGYEEGKARAEEECRAIREKAESLLREAELNIREARQKSKEIIASSEHKIVELAVAVAERLVRTQLSIDPDTITAVVRDTMNILNGGDQVELYVNPADLDSCLNFSKQLKDEFREISRLEILPDEGIPRGSCRIESESGVAEYLLEEEKEQLKETLLKLARDEEDTLIAEEDSSYGNH
jgi:flagellar assembly protein FliH